jgi:hypothetical protein
MDKHDNAYQTYNDIKAWTMTLISRYGHVVVAYAADKTSNKKTLKDYKSALCKLQKSLLQHKREATTKAYKLEYRELYNKVKALYGLCRQTMSL